MRSWRRPCSNMQTRDQSSHCKHACAKIPKIPTRKHATHETTANMQTCKHANMRRYQGSRRYQRYQRSRRHNTQTGKRNYPPHAREGVRNHTRRSSSTRSPTTYARQNISDALADSHTHARASEMHAERIPTRSDSIRMQSRNPHDAHGISSHTRPRASPLHAEANPTPNQNGRCNEAPLPTQ